MIERRDVSSNVAIDMIVQEAAPEGRNQSMIATLNQLKQYRMNGVNCVLLLIIFISILISISFLKNLIPLRLVYDLQAIQILHFLFGLPSNSGKLFHVPILTPQTFPVVYLAGISTIFLDILPSYRLV